MASGTGRSKSILSSLFVLLAAGCGGTGWGDPSDPSTITGVAATGAPVAGIAGLRDSPVSPELVVPISPGTGVFLFKIVVAQPPFILRASTLFSMSGAPPGTANINPFSTLIVADAGHFANISSMSSFYRTPERARLQTIFASMTTARRTFHQKLDPLLAIYNLTGVDPITDPFSINHGLDLLFNDVSTAFEPSGRVAMTNRNGAIVFSAPLGNLQAGTLTTDNILTPGTGGATTTTGSGSGTGTTGSGTGTTGSGTGTTGSGTGTTGSGTGPASPGSGPATPGTGTTGPGTPPTGPGTGTTGPGTGTTGPGTGTTGSGTGPASPGSGPATPGTGTTSPGTIGIGTGTTAR